MNATALSTKGIISNDFQTVVSSSGGTYGRPPSLDTPVPKIVVNVSGMKIDEIKKKITEDVSIQVNSVKFVIN